jgi:hypothetical protein
MRGAYREVNSIKLPYSPSTPTPLVTWRNQGADNSTEVLMRSMQPIHKLFLASLPWVGCCRHGNAATKRSDQFSAVQLGQMQNVSARKLIPKWGIKAHQTMCDNCRIWRSHSDRVMSLCNQLRGSWCSGGICALHLQGLRTSMRTQFFSACLLFSRWFLATCSLQMQADS